MTNAELDTIRIHYHITEIQGEPLSFHPMTNMMYASMEITRRQVQNTNQ
uniref:Uncharacterized protein n=1 Tax=Arundo donax TaxID=35708 RepID=A0A0A8YFP6_ARUDO